MDMRFMRCASFIFIFFLFRINYGNIMVEDEVHHLIKTPKKNHSPITAASVSFLSHKQQNQE